MIEINNLHVNVEGREILKGLDLALPQGEVHAIMGPNGSGKSTLAYVLAGKGEHSVDSHRAQQRTFARHVRAAHDQHAYGLCGNRTPGLDRQPRHGTVNLVKATNNSGKGDGRVRSHR